MPTTSIKLMLLRADAIWTISNTTKYLTLLNFLSGQEGPGAVHEGRVISSLFSCLCCQVIGYFCKLGFAPGVSHGDVMRHSGPYSSFSAWDTSPMGLLHWYNLRPHPVPEPKDGIHCPTGTPEGPKEYLLAEGRGDNVLKASMSNSFGSISYLSPWYFRVYFSILPTTSAHYYCTRMYRYKTRT